MGQYDVQTVGDGYPVPYPVYKVTALARDLLVGRDGSAQVAPQEGRFFGGKH